MCGLIFFTFVSHRDDELLEKKGMQAKCKEVSD